MKLHYFSGRGRGEQVRLLCHALDAPLEEVVIGKAEFGELRSQGPGVLLFKALPMLEDGDLMLPQGAAIMSYIGHKYGGAPSDPALDAKALAVTLGAEDLRSKYFGLFGEGAKEKQAAFIEGAWTDRWLPALSHLLERGDGRMVNGELSYADIAVWDALNAITEYVDATTYEGFDSVKAFYDEIAALPKLQKYLSARPQE
jgi:glutathione S-transferase